MPAYLVHAELEARTLVVVPFEGGARYTLSPVAVHPRSRPLGKAGTQLLAMLRG
jgi:hypothetical protein